jgi:ATP-dependent RNA helicase RhlE
MPFSQLGLSAPVLQGVRAVGYSEPTLIQRRAIPPILEGRDLIASAQTGTGKTAAFALPILTRLKTHGRCRCLVLEPTRELAAQVETAFRDFSRFTNFRAALIHGGVGYHNQRRELERGVDLVLATPGRLEDHLQRRALRLDEIEILVLDEVDRMLDIGFLPAVRRIVSRCPKSRQTLFFSATVPPQIAEFAAWALRDPVRIEIGASRTVATSVTHAIYPVAFDRKRELLLELLRATEFDSVLIFTRTKRGADKVAAMLRAANHTVAALHANRSQNQRMEALSGFKSGKYDIMVATDIASRGIDVAGVSHVINYDVPEHPEDYVHRVGRTGRAQKVGDAFTLVTREEEGRLRAIERFIGQAIPRAKLAGFPERAARPPEPSPAPQGPRPPPAQGGAGHGFRRFHRTFRGGHGGPRRFHRGSRGQGFVRRAR